MPWSRPLEATPVAAARARRLVLLVVGESIHDASLSIRENAAVKSIEMDAFTHW
jgi:hypothetical protein